MENRLKYGPVKSIHELAQVQEDLKIKFVSKQLLFRGQDKFFNQVMSGRIRPNIQFNAEVENGWHSFAHQIMQDLNSSEEIFHEIKAILQHYGMATHYIDLTSDIDVASWFATNEYSIQKQTYIGTPFRMYNKEVYTQKKIGSGYILVFAIEGSEKLVEDRKLFNLTKIPVEFSRPHAQKGWLMYQRPPVLPDPNSYWVATIELDCSFFTSQLTVRDLFPNPKIDLGYRAILSAPYVQLPLIYYHDLEKYPDMDSEDNRWCFGARVVGIGDHEFEGLDEFNHKWNDQTLYEPHPMRSWKFWRYPLENHYSGLSGDIKNSVKITLAPWVVDKLNSISTEGIDLLWPDFGKNDLLFSFSQIQHDKVDERELKTEGVWLHKEDDFILEHPVTSDEDTLDVHAGHGFLFQSGKVSRQSMEKSCKCGVPESHDSRVKAVLSLSSLIKSNQAVLMPHPSIPDWYVVF